MKGFLIGVTVVVIGTAGIWLWNKNHEEIEETTKDEDVMALTEDN